ncbi:hypothetical protein BC830DRAFT_785384 [Chytriomyces sp. MP71]|nr:hypothetical protein BC830DRAFT_785384 [Chytriomyces sp. MP71]
MLTQCYCLRRDCRRRSNEPEGDNLTLRRDFLSRTQLSGWTFACARLSQISSRRHSPRIRTTSSINKLSFNVSPQRLPFAVSKSTAVSPSPTYLCMQIQADVLDIPVEGPIMAATTALSAVLRSRSDAASGSRMSCFVMVLAT